MNPEAVKEQLERIIAGRSFKAAPRLAKFLRYLVTEMLEGRSPTDRSVTLEFFKKKEPPTFENPQTIARRNLHRLRRALEDYYTTDGSDDSIQIVFERGFLPQFRPRQTTPFHKHLERGLFQIDLEAPANIERALAHFNDAIRLAPLYLEADELKNVSEAHAGKAMALCTKTLHDIGASPAELFPEADLELAKALDRNPKSWRALCARGGLYAFRRKWKEADADFNTARKIHKEGMLDHGAYGPYLLGRGKYAEARSLARRDEGKNKYTDVTFLKRAALFLYALRDFAEAERILNELFPLNEALWHAHTLEAMVCLATARPEKALSHMREISSQKYPDLWPGLHVLCLERNGYDEEARERFDKLTHEAASRYIEPMQLALGYMAFDEPQLAIECLEDGAEVGDIHMLWLHLWPFLDPLRAYREFRELLLKLTLPAPPGSRRPR